MLLFFLRLFTTVYVMLKVFCSLENLQQLSMLLIIRCLIKTVCIPLWRPKLLNSMNCVWVKTILFVNFNFTFYIFIFQTPIIIIIIIILIIIIIKLRYLYPVRSDKRFHKELRGRHWPLSADWVLINFPPLVSSPPFIRLKERKCF